MNVANRRPCKPLVIAVSLTLILFASLTIATVRAAEPQSKSRIPTIIDKTLVAWVSLADTKQQAGSALTLIDPAEKFDAIVFAEIARGKWMAGSDTFQRTQRDQSGFPVETADAKTFVQMAIVYDKDEIRVYRNAKLYSRHKIGSPQPFKQDAMVLIGLRYVGGMGEIGFLAGAVEEARIYNVALNAATLAALKPNEPSAPKPIGQWTFEDGKATDSTGTFPPGELRGNARISNGKLHLDGKTAYMISAPPEPPFDQIVQTMFYKANSRKTGRIWDTWLYLHEGTYYLYYLANAGRRWDNVSMAVSSDGVHWKEKGRVQYKRPEATWMGTGSTWKSPNHQADGKFIMNFSEWTGPRQTIFFAESTDLLNWKRLPDEYEFQQDTRWYEPNGRWDCIYTIPRPGGGLYGYWTATPKKETGGRFGFGETLDGAHWKALPPPVVHGAGGGEAGAVEKIGEKFYMMFGTGGKMVTLVADRPQGPFHAAKKNFHLLSGHTYFSRFFPTPDGVLVNHHAIAGTVYFSPLKSTVIDDEGTLRLGWWKGNEKLKHEPAEVKLPAPARSDDSPIATLQNTFDADRGIILEGTIALPSTDDSTRRGLYVECEPGNGVGILIAANGAVELGTMKSDATQFKVVKAVDREMQFGRPARFRLLLKYSLIEFYLDDVLIECYSLPATATGRVGLIRGTDGKSIGALRAWY
ncbi:MAG: hypothetical protein HQ567_12640 [Candidatus Nealsonbacteria bacterium]|nr:hypothetical protein [Candidatus Nealsonbacteria bacterium]